MRKPLSNRIENRSILAVSLLAGWKSLFCALTLLPGWALAQGSGPGPTQFVTGTSGPSIAPPPNPVTGERTFEITTPVGPLAITVSHGGSIPPTSLRRFSDPSSDFRPPSIFSAPLPTGSGARALGFSGSFTAIADDATAASWNPAGLVNLEDPEVSAVGRHSYTRNQHRSTNPDFQVGTDSYDSSGLNYASGVYPLYINKADRALVISLNYQEAYDFTQEFNARILDRSQETFRSSNRRTDQQTQTDSFEFEGGRIMLDVMSEFTTTSRSSLRQTIETETTADLKFRQQGVIEAISPAAAIEITPRLFAGVAANFYQDSALPGKSIEARTLTEFTTISRSRFTRTTSQTTEGSFTLNGTIATAGIPPAIPPGSVDIPDISGDYPAFTDTRRSSGSSTFITEGYVEERDDYDSLDGANATLGVLYTANRFLTLGATVDLPWTADARQTKTTRSESTTWNADRSRVINQAASFNQETRRVKFNFPLFASAGAVWRWHQHLYSSLDVAYTDWSAFSFEVAGQGKINPFNGQPHGQQRVDDTFAVRVGTEYLWVTRKHEIPFRGGLVWEQHPAIGRPDDFYGFSLGTGMSFGEEGKRLILDIAYSYLRGDDVQTIVPDEPGLSTDTEQHQVFFSAIGHF